MVGQTLGHYRVSEKLGEGGMGVVYRAEDTKLGRDVALKVLSERLTHDAVRLARFEREARLLASLNHPNIAAIYGFEEAAGQRFLVLELVEGEDLAQRLKRGTPPLEETLDIARQVCDALEAAHERGVIHRDLKPANVKVTPQGKVKVLDFGLAKALAGDSGAHGLSQSPTISEIVSREGVILGTAAYMSPEQARGKPLDKRTDLWSFGCLLYELLTARGPFDADTVSDCIGAILHRQPDWALLPPETPPRVRHLLRRCLEKDAARRLRDIGDARLELEDALEKPTLEMPAGAYDRPPVATAARWRQALPWILAGLLAIALGLSLLLPGRGPATRPVTRFNINLPPTEPLNTWRTAVALSPDGSRLVYSASRDGVPHLFLREMGKTEPVALAGTEGATGPFFSPDGEQVGFLASRDLKRVSLRDGTVSAITVAPPIGCGAAWGPDDSIIYSFAIGLGGLYRVPAAGGKGEPFTRLDAAKNELSHCWPEVLPGGKALVFTVLTAGGIDQARIVAARLDGDRVQEWTTLIEGGSHARYSPTGHLVYARAGELMAVPFDPNRLVTTGPAVPLHTNVLVSSVTASAQFSLSPQGSLVLVSGGMQETQRTLVWVDRQGGVQPLDAPPRAYSDPRFSPDRRLLAVSLWAEANEDIWVYDLARGTLSRVTSHAARELLPVWTPDGKRIVFSSDRNRRPHDIYSAPLGGGVEELVPTHPLDQPKSFPEFAFDISPDGRTLAFAADHIIEKGTGWDLLVLPLQGEHTPQPFLDSSFDEIQPAFSPDGRRVAYASNETGRWEIYVVPFPGPGAKVQISTEGGLEPRWSVDGRELFYRNLDKMMAVDTSTSASGPFAAGAPRLLFEGRFLRGGTNPGWANYDVTADGRRFLMIRSEQEGGPTQMTVVLNWLDELRRLAPAK